MKILIMTTLLGLASMNIMAVGENSNTSGSTPESCCNTGKCGTGMPLCSGLSQKRVSKKEKLVSSPKSKRNRGAGASKQ